MAAFAVALARSGASFAQIQPAHPLIGVALGGGQAPGSEEALLRGLHDEGLEQGQHFDLAYRSTEGRQDKTSAMVREVVGLKPAVIVSQTTLLSVELRRATRKIPIVGTALTDPVGLGLATSYAHPGGNVTGVLAAASAQSKLMELLVDAVPGITKVGLLFNPLNPGNLIGVDRLKSDVSSLAVDLVPVEARVADDLEPAFRRLTEAGVGAVYLAQDAMFAQERKRIADLAIAARLPTANGFRQFADAGILLAYGSDPADRWRIAGVYAGKILKGAKAGDLPIEQQPKLELVINLKTAKAIGLDLPRSLTARADAVIE